ncbi:MAG TPA: SDR family oxidoreductase [Solirubrobacterales bacterium]|jgi:NAD(P)-dependent dehydrogenase (short-subunit alcohol dehydrogenase family)|nr:SDR family oxidoreductase [Solirubrobacterales bacterium]
MLLKDKVAVVYGAGSIGGAVARAFGTEGARVFIGDRTGAKAEALAAEIEAAGGSARGLEVDALDEDGVRGFVEAAVDEAGRLDISFDLISVGDAQGTPLVEMAWDDFMRPIETAVRTNFLTVKAAAPHMVRGGGGAVLFFGGSGDPVPNYSIGGFQVALHAVEAMRRQYASELGAAGVRFVTLRTGGIPDTIPDVMDGGEELSASLNAATMTGRAATLEDVGTVAAFVASDKARTMTAATVNVSAGALID